MIYKNYLFTLKIKKIQIIRTIKKMNVKIWKPCKVEIIIIISNSIVLTRLPIKIQSHEEYNQNQFNH
jgi:hypothetical protein